MLKLGKKYGLQILLLIMLAVYCGAILVINFSMDPTYYVTDMYSDIQFAQEAWKHKSIFPEGWVFGNQFYAVATPVVAAVFCGLLENPAAAMAMASTVMAAGVLLSFCWLLRAVTRDRSAILAGVVALLAVTLYFGDTVYETKGWQLLFTMCSYYACYAITAFLAFGCFLRRKQPRSNGFVGVLILTCFLSLGTGIQSLRQTVIMTCPMIAVEGLVFLVRLIRKEKLWDKSMLVTILIVVSNLLGVVISKLVSVPSVTIYGGMQINSLSRMVADLFPSIYMATSLIHSGRGWLDLAVKLVVVLGAVVTVWRWISGREESGGETLLLFVAGLAVLLVVDVCTEMFVRDIYYFMLYPLIAFLLVMLFRGRMGTCGCVLLLLALFVLNGNEQLLKTIEQPGRQTVYHEISDYLEANGYQAVYSYWDEGEKVAIASECRLKAGFWHTSSFVRSNYLCNPEVYNVPAENSVYLFQGEERLALAEAVCREMGKEMKLLKYFPEGDIYLYTAQENLMY